MDQSTATEREMHIENLAHAICDIRGVDLTDHPDLRYLAQRLVDRGWEPRCRP